ncbi:trimethylamine methyltransferase family protein [bacterium]|nr:trimethylamine methyltransferase family protein [bacterium]
MASLYGALNPFAPSDLRKIHHASLAILDQAGAFVAHEPTLDCLAAAGWRIDRDRQIVRFDGDRVEHLLTAFRGDLNRGPRRETLSVSVDSGSQAVYDYATRRHRPVGMRDLVDVPRLADGLEHVDEAGTLVMVPDMPPPLWDLFNHRYAWTYTRKTGGGGLGRNPSFTYSYYARSIEYLLELAAIKYGGPEELRRHPVLSLALFPASPLRWDGQLLEHVFRVAAAGQIIGVGSNVIAGIQSPITPAANIALDNAERLAGLCIVKAIDATAPVFFCNQAYQLDMSSGDVASGSPEQTLMPLLGQKLLEYYGWHLMVNHPVLDTSAHVPDAQAAAEKMMYLLFTGLGGSKGIGGVGQLKECFCYEQAVIDNELAGYVKHLLTGAVIDDETLAVDLIVEQGPGGNFLDTDHTVKHLRDCYHRPGIFGRSRLSEWTRNDGQTALERAHARVREILAADPTRYLTPEQETAMDEVIERARRELAPEWRPQWAPPPP